MIRDRKDVWMVLAVFVCGYLFWDFVLFTPFGAGVPIFTLILCGVTMLYFLKKGVKLDAKSFLWLGVMLLTAASFAIFAEEVIRGITFFLLVLLYIYWVAYSTGRTLDKKLSSYLLGDSINQGIVVPFSNIPCGVEVLTKRKEGKKKGKPVAAILLGLVLAVPVAIIVINLLSSADVAFRALLDKIVAGISFENLGEFLLRFFLAIPVFLYLFGLIYGNVHKRNTQHITKESLDKGAQKMAFMPRVSIYTALILFNVVYLTFFISQLSYLFSIFANLLPEDFTYADYARQGFFQLCAVAAINMAILAGVQIFTNREDMRSIPFWLRILSGILCLFSFLLTVAAFTKMTLYVDVYGLTRLRVYTMCFMVALALTFITVGIRQIRKFNAGRILVVVLLVVILGVSYGNVDGVIAKYNIDRYNGGTLKELDYMALCQLSDAAVPYVYEYYKTTNDKNEKEEIKGELLRAMTSSIEPHPWEGEGQKKNFREWNFQTAKADQIRAILFKELKEKKE